MVVSGAQFYHGRRGAPSRPRRGHRSRLGAAYAQLGDPANAIHWLRIAADTGFPCLSWFDADPLLEPVRTLDAFAALRTYVAARKAASLTPWTS